MVAHDSGLVCFAAHSADAALSNVVEPETLVRCFASKLDSMRGSHG